MPVSTVSFIPQTISQVSRTVKLVKPLTKWTLVFSRTITKNYLKRLRLYLLYSPVRFPYHILAVYARSCPLTPFKAVSLRAWQPFILAEGQATALTCGTTRFSFYLRGQLIPEVRLPTNSFDLASLYYHAFR